MAATIKIKRSATAAGAPASLKSGELAYTFTGGVDRLYFGKGDDGSGNATSIVQIGGEYYTNLLSATAGTVTASKALIVDSSSKLDILNVDNITLNGNTISSTDSNGNLIFSPNGTGKVSFYNAYTFPTTLGTAGYALVSDGAGGLTWAGVNTANTATNLSGGTAGQVPYQSAPGVTEFYGPGTAGQILVSAGTSAPTYTSTSSIYVNSAINAETLRGGTTGQLVYQSSADTTGFVGPGTSGQLLVSAGTSAPVYTNTGSIYVYRATTADATLASVTFDNSNTGVASGTTFNGSVNRTVSANTIGALSLSGGGEIGRAHV